MFDPQPLIEFGVDPAVVEFVTEVAAVRRVEYLADSTDRRSRPLLGKAGSQVALYVERGRVAVALPPDVAKDYADRLSRPFEKDNDSTVHIHFSAADLGDSGLRPVHVAAAVEALRAMSLRQGRGAGGSQHSSAVPTVPCTEHPWYPQAPACPTCQEEAS